MKPHNKPENSPPAPATVCILRLSALGDATHTVPVINAIRQQWPETRISWVIGKTEHRLLAGLEGVEFIVFNKAEGLAAFRRLRNQLRQRRFDALLHMQVAARANLASRLIRAPLRLGWDKARSRDLHHCFINRSVEAVPQQHQVQGFLSFARALGIPAQTPVWRLPVSAAARTFAEQQLPGEEPVLIISPCSSHPLRNWRPQYYAQVADYAHQHLQLRIALCGGPSALERSTAAAITAAMQAPAVNLVGKDTLPQSLALLQKAALVISPDSGPAHIANAMGTPVIGLYACTWSKRSGPYHSLPLCVDRFAEAARRFKNSEPDQLRWGTRIEKPGVMDLITPEAVMEKLDVWQRGGSSEA